MNKKLTYKFYSNDAFKIAPKLLGKVLVRKLSNGELLRYRIIELEIYYGEEDSACHARYGKTERTSILYEKGGFSYVYLCYGIHYLLNIVTGKKGHPEAILIRGIEGYDGPGKLTKAMNITKDLNKIDLSISEELWIEDDGFRARFHTTPRIGIDYASEPYRSIKWRYVMDE